MFRRSSAIRLNQEPAMFMTLVLVYLQIPLHWLPSLTNYYNLQDFIF
jgi:hypothetical protein